MKRVFLVLALSLTVSLAVVELFAQSSRRVTVVTQKGDVIEGMLKSATDVDMVVEVAGQPLRIPLETIGRAAAAIVRWESPRTFMVDAAVDATQALGLVQNVVGYNKLVALLNQARADLRFELGQQSVVVAEGQTFGYFEEVRKAIETARGDVFFVDPYLDAEFVSRYLPHAAQGVVIRLLGARKLAPLLSAVDAFAKQSGMDVCVRSSDKLHDRFLFIDQIACYFSGASFKDGAKNAPALWAQVGDAFPAMLETYERFWNEGKIERG